MDLHQIDALEAQLSQTVLDGDRQVMAQGISDEVGVPVPDTQLGGDHRSRFDRLQCLADDRLAVAVRRRRVEIAAAQLGGATEQPNRFGGWWRVHRVGAVTNAQLGAAETDAGDPQICGS